MDDRISTLRQRSERIVDWSLLFCVIVLVWQLLYVYVGPTGMSPPLATTIAASELLFSEDFWPNVRTTFSALGTALLLEIISGLLIGIALGLNRLGSEVAEPILVSFYSVPKIVFYPVILLLCGGGYLSGVIYGVIHGIIPIMLFSMNAVRTIRPVLLKTGRVFQLTQWQMMRQIAIPAAIPEIFSGLRFGFSVTLVGVLFAEMFASKSGLGHLLMNAINLMIVDRVMSVTLLLAVFTALINVILLAIDRRLHRRI